MIKVDQENVFSKDAISDAQIMVDYLKKNGSIQLGQFRDMLGTSRKFAMAILDYFDKNKITKRIEDKRVLYKDI